MQPCFRRHDAPVPVSASSVSSTDNGSEFINRTVAELLEKLRIEQTKSRPRQSGDNGLVETKNGAVIRKHIGYGDYINAGHADTINSFYRQYLNPYLNHHRPCAQADVEIDEKGRKRVRYKRYQTPLETLLTLDKPAQYLRPGLSVNTLKRIAGVLSDTVRGATHATMQKQSCSKSYRLTAQGPRLGQRKWRSMEKPTGLKPPYGFSKDLGNRKNDFHIPRPRLRLLV